MEAPLYDEVPYSSLEQAREFIDEFLCKENCMGPSRNVDSYEGFFHAAGGLCTTVSLLQKYPVLASEKFYCDFFAIEEEEKYSFYPLTYLIWSKLDTVILKNICALYPAAVYEPQGNYSDMLDLACDYRNVNASTIIWLLSLFSTEDISEAPGFPPFLSYMAAYLAEGGGNGDFDLDGISKDGRVIQAFLGKNSSLAEYSAKEVFALGNLRYWLFQDYDKVDIELDVPVELLISHPDTLFATLKSIFHSPHRQLRDVRINGWQDADYWECDYCYLWCPHLREDAPVVGQAQFEEANDILLDWLPSLELNFRLWIENFHGLDPQKGKDFNMQQQMVRYLQDEEAYARLGAWVHDPQAVEVALTNRNGTVMLEGDHSNYDFVFDQACSWREGVELGFSQVDIATATKKDFGAVLNGLRARQAPLATLALKGFKALNVTLLTELSETCEAMRVKSIGFAEELDPLVEKKGLESEMFWRAISKLPKLDYLSVEAHFREKCRRLVELKISGVWRDHETGTEDTLVDILNQQKYLRVLEIGCAGISMELSRFSGALCDVLKDSNTSLQSITLEGPHGKLAISCDTRPESTYSRLQDTANNIQHYLWLNKFGRGQIRDIVFGAGQFVELLVVLCEERETFESGQRDLSRTILSSRMLSHGNFFRTMKSQRDIWCPVLSGSHSTDTAALLYEFLRELPDLWCGSPSKSRKRRRL